MNAEAPIKAPLTDAQSRELVALAALTEKVEQHTRQFLKDPRITKWRTQLSMLELAEAVQTLFPDGVDCVIEEMQGALGIDAEGYEIDSEGYRTTIGPVRSAWGMV